MGFRSGSFGTVWKVNRGNGNYTDVQLSTSRKNKQTEQYETDFSGFVRFVGEAHKMAGNLKERDRIKIGDCEVTNSYNKEKNTTYTNFVVFNFESANGNSSTQQSKPSTSAASFVNVPDNVDDEELPFN